MQPGPEEMQPDPEEMQPDPEEMQPRSEEMQPGSEEVTLPSWPLLNLDSSSSGELMGCESWQAREDRVAC